ncbi:MAG: hypothetical protein IKB42_04175 [Clostridia bacterium]|nr:hypothetical protein [Clostridia bacterium]
MGSDLVVENLSNNKQDKIVTSTKNIKNMDKNSEKQSIFSKFFNIFNKTDNFVDGDKSLINSKKSTKGGVFYFLKNKQIKSLIVVLIFALLAFIILSSSFGEDLTTVNKNEKSYSYTSSLEYCEKLEEKLEEVLGGISGVGKLKVMVTVDSGPELKYATNSQEKSNHSSMGENSTTSTTILDEPIILTSSGSKVPLIVTEISPKVTGVVVVASGAKDVGIKLDLMQAVMVLLNISSNKVQIYS